MSLQDQIQAAADHIVNNTGAGVSVTYTDADGVETACNGRITSLPGRVDNMQEGYGFESGCAVDISMTDVAAPAYTGFLTFRGEEWDIVAITPQDAGFTRCEVMRRALQERTVAGRRLPRS